MTAKPKRAPAGKGKRAAWAAGGVIGASGLFWMTLRYPIPWPVGVYAIASVVTFFVYGWDKAAARGGRRRVPEKALHGLAAVGGWPGALLAQQTLRHKTRKITFQIAYWSIVAAHAALWIAWWMREAQPPR